MNIYDDTRCQDCRVETNHLMTDKCAEWYIVFDSVWEQATKDTPANFLCIGCLEKRLSRKLTRADFSDAPLNSLSGYGRSRRLRNRLGITYQ